MKKLLFVIPTLRYGGAELFLLRICSQVQSNYSVKVVVLGKREGLATDFESLNIEVFYLGFENVTSFFHALVELRLIFARIKPDIIHSFLYVADIISGLASVGLNTPRIIWSLRGTNLPKGSSFRKHLVLLIAAFLSRFIPHAIVACSEQAREFHTKLGYPYKKIVCIGNTLPPWVSYTQSRSILLRENRPESLIFGLAARFDLGKGHVALAHSIAMFLQENPQIEITLKFAGKGCLPESLLEKELMRNGDIAVKVQEESLKIDYCGLVPVGQMAQWFSSLDVYFMASNSVEGFPNSLAEAVSVGVPSLANPIGASIDFLPKTQISRTAAVIDMKNNIDHLCRIPSTQRKMVATQCRNSMLLKYSDRNVLREYFKVWNDDNSRREQYKPRNGNV